MTPRITEAGEVMGNLRSNGYGRDWSMGVGEVREHYLSKEAASQNQGISNFHREKPEANDLSFRGDWAPCPRKKWVCEEMWTLAASHRQGGPLQIAPPLGATVFSSFLCWEASRKCVSFRALGSRNCCFHMSCSPGPQERLEGSFWSCPRYGWPDHTGGVWLAANQCLPLWGLVR